MCRSAYRSAAKTVRLTLTTTTMEALGIVRRSLAGDSRCRLLHTRPDSSLRCPPAGERIVDAIGAANRRKADREIARVAARNGGRLTGAVERRIGASYGGRF